MLVLNGFEKCFKKGFFKKRGFEYIFMVKSIFEQLSWTMINKYDDFGVATLDITWTLSWYFKRLIFDFSACWSQYMTLIWRTNVCVINSEKEKYYFIKEIGLIIKEIYINNNNNNNIS